MGRPGGGGRGDLRSEQKTLLSILAHVICSVPEYLQTESNVILTNQWITLKRYTPLPLSTENVQEKGSGLLEALDAEAFSACWHWYRAQTSMPQQQALQTHTECGL